MDHLLAGSGLRLSYLRDRASINRLDTQRIQADLSEPGTRYALCWWFSTVCLAEFDHIVLATDCDTGCYVAMLAANDGDVDDGPYLCLQAAFAIDAMRGSTLMRRMLAYAIIRMAGLGNTIPRIIAAPTSTPACYRMLAQFAQTVPNATVFPEPDAAAIDMRGAGLARRIARSVAPHSDYAAANGTIIGSRLRSRTCFARTTAPDPALDTMFERNLRAGDQMMVVIDMRDSDEKTITDKTRGLVRARWKTPVQALHPTDAPPPTRISRRKPTLTA